MVLVMTKITLSGFLRLVSAFLLTAGLCLGMLLLSTQVPRSSIALQMQKSAEYLCEGELFGEVVKDVSGTKIDRYADSILLGIAWQFDGREPLRSVMEAAYYHQPWQNENENLWDAVTQDLSANQQYLRYWHGSAGIVRMMMVWMTLPKIYCFHGILLAVLFALLLFRLLRRRVLALALAIGFAGTACWFVPLSLEYTWVFLIMLVQANMILSVWFPKDWNKRTVFFLISGMLTCYLDFLSCETLTLTVPLLILLWLDKEAGDSLPSWKRPGMSVLCWLIRTSSFKSLKQRWKS